MRALEDDLLSDAAFARAVLPAARSLRGLAGPIVVGIATDERSRSTLEWAAAEAAAQRCPLRLVHASRPPMVLDAACGLAVLGGMAADVTAREVLRSALGHVRLLAPDVTASAQVVPGTPASVLLRESRHARLLVVGAQPRGQPGAAPRFGHGALRARVVAGARCPVAVVHRPRDPWHSLVRPRVVVGVDGTACSDAAVGFALATASRRGLPVTAVHAWTEDHPADLEAVTAPLLTSEEAAHHVLATVLDRWTPRFPAVPVTAEVVHRDAAGALIAGSADASLVVVGCRGLGRIRTALFGSVSHAVLEGAAGPVAVVHRGPGLGG
jgi:nucleotide-binding universal stress UspA family protein